MIYELKRTKKFRKDVKSMIKRGKNPELLLELIDRLQHDEALATHISHFLERIFTLISLCDFLKFIPAK